jgi:nucleotidyltransferase/DNA polymerase involved in DNA repair
MYLGRANELCPDLIVLQYEFEGYEEVSEAVTEILENHAAQYGGFVETVSCDEAYVEFFLQGGNELTPCDVAKMLAESIRQEIFDVTQCTATIGVSYNKLLAKLGTDHVKPNKSFLVEDYKGLLKTLKLGELHGIGYRLRQRLEGEGLVTVEDVWDMRSRGEGELCRILGPGLGKKIYGFCQGRDSRAVQPAERKTIGAEVRLFGLT